MTTLPPPPPVSRVLLAAVIGMGVLIVIGTAGLIGVVIHRAMAPKTVSAPLAALGSHDTHDTSYKAAPAQTGAAPVFAFQGGGHVLSQNVRPDGSLSVLIASPQGEQIVIWSPESNRITARFVLNPAP